MSGSDHAAAAGGEAGMPPVGPAIGYAFANGIYRVDAHARVGNHASERVFERLGFAREGVKRRYLRHQGRRVDATLFARLADDE